MRRSWQAARGRRVGCGSARRVGAALAAHLRRRGCGHWARQHPPRPVEAPLAPAVWQRRRGLWLWPAAAAVLLAAGLTAWRIERFENAPVSQPTVAAEPSGSVGTAPAAVVAASSQLVKHHSAVSQGDMEKPAANQGIAEVSVTDPQAPTHGTTDELSMLFLAACGRSLRKAHPIRFQAELKWLPRRRRSGEPTP